MPIRMSRHGRARRLNDEGMALRDAGRDAEAIARYREAVRMDPDWAAPWYNIGLVHKYRCEWADSLAANREALRRAPRDEAAIWNLGIAATALADWSAARDAWRRYGIRVPQCEGPVELFIGLTPIRVANDGHPEVVWADRIDPARAVIRSVPLPESGRRYGDLVLHDGAPNGYRRLRGREVAVFDELEVLRPSPPGTFGARVHSASQEDVQALDALGDAADVHVENWSANVQVLCKACSEGRPFAEGGHDHPPARDAGEGMRLGVAARDEAQARAVLTAWARERRLELGALDCLLPPAAIH